MVPGATVHGEKTLHADEELFADHFPGFPVIPGVLLIEMMAQTAGKCLDAENRSRGKAMLVQVRKASFRRWMQPDERADIFARITSTTDDYGSAACHIEVSGERTADADLVFAFVPLARLAPDYHDDVLDRFVRSRS